MSVPKEFDAEVYAIVAEIPAECSASTVGTAGKGVKQAVREQM